MAYLDRDSGKPRTPFCFLPRSGGGGKEECPRERRENKKKEDNDIVKANPNLQEKVPVVFMPLLRCCRSGERENSGRRKKERRERMLRVFY